MPVLSWAHSAYWSGAGGGAPPDAPLGKSLSGGYIPWMTTITRLGGLVGLGVVVHWQQSR
jgi:hypothetical protein